MSVCHSISKNILLCGRVLEDTTTLPLATKSLRNVITQDGGVMVCQPLSACVHKCLPSTDGYQVFKNGTENFAGCRDSDFDQYGDMYAFGQYPEVSGQNLVYSFLLLEPFMCGPF